MLPTRSSAVRGGSVRRRVAAAVLAILGLAAGGCATAQDAGAGGDSLSDQDYPPVGVAAPAACPSTWELTDPPTATRAGSLVPTGATEALLCTYPLPHDPPRTPTEQALGPVHALADPAELIAYLNGLPTNRPSPPRIEDACAAAAGAQYTIVVGYPDRQPAVVRLGWCVLEQGGNLRYGADLRVLTAFFGAGLYE
jgi:hypothetical protein